MRIAVVGSGAAGLSAYWALNGHSEHEVELFEAEAELGGHAHAIQVQVPGKQPCYVDNAFVMLNEPGYPAFWQFLKHKSIPLVRTDTSFSVTRRSFAWGSQSLSALFATPGSICSPRVWEMIFDLFRFHYTCLDLLAPQSDQEEGVTVGEYLDTHGYGAGFRDDYLLPLAATYWSLPPARVLLDCPIAVLVRNFHQHGLLQLWDRPIWYTIKDGSRSYIEAIKAGAPGGSIHLSTPIRAVRRSAEGMVVVDHRGQESVYDHVVLATHADITLDILRRGGSLSASDEKALLAASDWSEFEIVMHHDETSMPGNRKVWGAWNTLLPEPARDTDAIDALEKNVVDPLNASISCTFDMNRLHDLPIAKHGHILGTLNPPHPIDSSKIFARLTYSTPIFTPQLIAAQTRLKANEGDRQDLSLIGAWTGLGTHEDAWASGLSVAVKLGAKLPFSLPHAHNVHNRHGDMGKINQLVRSILILVLEVGKDWRA